MFRKFLEPKIERRIKSLNELHKYLDERWLARSAEKEMAGEIRLFSDKILLLKAFLFVRRIRARRAESLALLVSQQHRREK